MPGSLPAGQADGNDTITLTVTFVLIIITKEDEGFLKRGGLIDSPYPL